MNDNPKDNELKDFLYTLKIHNKDLDACFNDALAENHLRQLIEAYVNRRIVSELEAALAAEPDREDADFASQMLALVTHVRKRLDY